MLSAHIKPTHKSIQGYYENLKAYSAQNVTHEMGLRSAFQHLLEDTGRPHKWTLVPEQSLKVRGKTVRPDGTFRDEWHLPCGYWEAKDTSDDLDSEVRAKIAKGYPLTNTIFEDTCHAILFQNGHEVFRIPLGEPAKLADLLNAFYTHTKPDIESFKEAVEHFKERIPDLARALNERVDEAHKHNAKFKTAFADFFEICKNSLNPNLRREAVDEMLVQHLLTERLFRTVFDNPDFTKRNVIAVEIERVIEALASQSFSRADFLRKLDHFYKAIEDAAHGLEDWSDKQHFLNTVYERFFQGYSVKVADTHGIVYTPQVMVDFMCASVEEVLKTQFGKGLGAPGVNILDPCTGTGNFIVNLMRRVPRKDLQRMYREQFFANEVMLLPYYIAAMNIEHAYFELTGTYEAFPGLCFVDTLELAEGAQQSLSFMTEANTARVERQKKAPITVVIGNPPYNANQLNENDNNKNRTYAVIESRIQETYVTSSVATLRNKLYDPYVKFFRWSTDRLHKRPGIVCMVTNNGFLDGRAFDGFRYHLCKDFDRIYHLNLKGNARTTGERRRAEGGNVFSDLIRAGVGITILVQNGTEGQCELFYDTVGDHWSAEQKTHYLSSFANLSDVSWQKLVPDRCNNWLATENAGEFESFMGLGQRGDETIFKVFSTGAKSNRDDVVYDFDSMALSNRVERFVEQFNGEVDRYKRTGAGKGVDDFVDYSRVKWSSTLKSHLLRGNYAEFSPRRIRVALYRPYTKRYVYYDAILNDRPGLFRSVLPTSASEEENNIICCTNHLQIGFVLGITNCIANEAVGGRAGQCFPFYIYDEDGRNRRENVTDWALDQFRTHYNDPTITKWDIFQYVYGVLHHPGYRARFADNLKREIPRIPLMADFRAFSATGKRLAKLHLGYEMLEPWPLEWIENRDIPLSYRVEKMRLSKDKTELKINDSLSLAKIPPEVFRYRLGNRSALEWVIDQYQVSEDKRNGIRSDPNRDDDPEYIVRLVGQVMRVSMETVALVDKLPPCHEFIPAEISSLDKP